MATKPTIKNVYYYQACTECDFENILVDPRFQKPIRVDKKDIEIKHAERHPDNTITGIFVATKLEGIAPKHKPGEEDFSAIVLNEGEGLAYPNTFLFSPKGKILLLEYNKAGCSAQNICDYFNSLQKEYSEHIDLKLNILLTEDAYKRIQNLSIIEKIEVQIANPINVIRKEFAETAPLKDFANIAQEFNATKSINIILAGELATGGLTKTSTLQWLKHVLQIGHKTSGLKVKNKFVVKGKNTTDEETDSTKEEIIDLFIDKIKGQFILDEPPVQKDIQAHERKKGIKQVYNDKSKEIMNIIDINNPR